MSRPRLLLPVLVTIVTSAPVSTAQSFEDVLRVLRQGKGDFEDLQAAGEQFHAWGDAALPHLATIAHDGDLWPGTTWEDRLHGDDFAQALLSVGTEQSARFLAELLVGSGDFEPGDALGTVWSWLVLGFPHAEVMEENPDFEKAVVAFAADESRVRRSWCADIVGARGWSDQLPVLRELLRDPVLDVRRAAADAITLITNEPVDFEQPAPDFPATALGAAWLVGPVASLTYDEQHPIGPMRIQPWLDGRTRIVQAHGPALHLLDARLEERARLDAPHPVIDFVALPTTQHVPVIAAAVWTPDAEFPTWIAVDASGAERWRFEPDDEPFQTESVPIPGDDGSASGVVFIYGGTLGAIAFDLDGVELWRTGERHVAASALGAHPALPGVVVTAAGEPAIVRAGGEVLDAAWDLEPYVWGMTLFPDDAGEPALLVVGPGDESMPTIERLDAELQVVWLATVPEDVDTVVRVEAPGEDRVFIAGTRADVLYLFDEHGTLLGRHELPGGVVPVGLQAGVVDGRRLVAVQTVEQLLVYELATVPARPVPREDEDAEDAGR